MTLTEEEKKKIEQEELFRAEVRNKKGSTSWYKPQGCGTWGCLIVIALSVIGIAISSTVKGGANPTKNNNASPAKTAEQIEAERSLKAEERKQNVISLSDAFCKSRQGEYSYGYFFCFGCVDLKTIATYFQLSQGESTTISNAKAPAKKEDCDKVADLCLNYWSNQECLGVAGRKLWIGMSDTQLEVSMGIPKDRNNTVGSWGTHSQWVYGDSFYVYLEGKSEKDMVVTSWQD